ncbi:hypothetical protein D3C87_1571040 [compost metagenome]
MKHCPPKKLQDVSCLLELEQLLVVVGQIVGVSYGAAHIDPVGEGSLGAQLVQGLHDAAVLANVDGERAVDHRRRPRHLSALAIGQQQRHDRGEVDVVVAGHGIHQRFQEAVRELRVMLFVPTTMRPREDHAGPRNGDLTDRIVGHVIGDRTQHLAQRGVAAA